MACPSYKMSIIIIFYSCLARSFSIVFEDHPPPPPQPLYSGISRGVLRVPPVQLNNSSQHRKQIVANLLHISSKTEVIMGGAGHGHTVHAQICNSTPLIQILETPLVKAASKFYCIYFRPQRYYTVALAFLAYMSYYHYLDLLQSC